MTIGSTSITPMPKALIRIQRSDVVKPVKNTIASGTLSFKIIKSIVGLNMQKENSGQQGIMLVIMMLQILSSVSTIFYIMLVS